MIQNYMCKYCKSENLILKEVGPHCGLYCKKCGKWQQWISKTDMDIAKQQGWQFGDIESKSNKIVSDFDVVY